MVKTDLRAAFRSLKRHPAYAAVNVAGLSLGVAATLMILLYARHELTYDAHNEHADRTYLVYKERITPSGTQATYDTWVPMLERLQTDFPVIEAGTRAFTRPAWVQVGDKRFRIDLTVADSSLFDVFTLPLARGDDGNPLPDHNSVVISNDVSRRFFGDDDPIGKTLTIAFQRDVAVTGVLEDVPNNSILRPQIIYPITAADWYGRFAEDWGNSFLSTYVLLREGAKIADLEAQMSGFATKVWDEETAQRTNVKFLPLLDQFDTFNGNRKYAYILLAIAFAIILIACVNFVNLATARSGDSAREIGVRKVLGAFRPELARRFLAESLVLVAVSFGLGILLTRLVLPWFNDIYGTDLEFDAFGHPWTVTTITLLAVVVAMLSGMYPAIFMSRFDPIRSLRGSLRSGGLRLRRVLVVGQFSISIALIAVTIVMWKQIDYMKHRDKGLDADNVIVVAVEPSDFADRDSAVVHLAAFKDALRRRSDVVSVGSSTHVPGDWSDWFTFVRPEGGDPTKPLRMRFSFTDAAYFATYGIRFVEGRPFIESSEAEEEHSVIVNEAAVRDFGWETAVGKTVRRGDTDYTIVGVVSDYNYQSLQEAVAPVIHGYRPSENGVHNFVSVRIRSNDLARTIEGLSAVWSRLDSGRPFTYHFADEELAALYEAQDRLATVASAFSMLAIVIACLGLFGLASHMVVRRTKEIGVRRVLGASVANVAIVLSGEFGKLVVVAFMVGAPLAWIASRIWLEDFAYRTTIPWYAFIVAGAAALLISLATIGWRTVGAAMMNPVKALRYE